MATVLLIHGGQSTKPKLEAALPGAEVIIVYREGLSGAYDEKTGLASEYPTLRELLGAFAPSWHPGVDLVVLGFSAGAWALRHYLRDAEARADITAAVFLDGLYGAPGGACNLAPYDGVLAYAELAQEHPAEKRLVMTYSSAHPAPGICSNAIAQAVDGGEGPGVFVLGYQSGDHGSQQGIVGPEVLRDLIAPWIGRGGGSSLIGRIAAALGLAGLGWFIARRLGW